MNRRVPNLAILIGVLGLVPLIVLALAEMGAAVNESLRLLGILIAYSAALLAFFGGVHWGFALLGSNPASESARVDRARLLLGVVPALIAWLALLLPYVAPPDLGLAVLVAGYVATIVVEDQARRRGFAPSGYVWLRWGITLVVVALLVTVLVLRLLGARIVF